MPTMISPTGERTFTTRAGAEVLLRRGYRLAAVAERDAADASQTTPPGPARPGERASKAEWVAYAQSFGIDGVEDMTVREILAAVAERDAADASREN